MSGRCPAELSEGVNCPGDMSVRRLNGGEMFVRKLSRWEMSGDIVQVENVRRELSRWGNVCGEIVQLEKCLWGNCPGGEMFVRTLSARTSAGNDLSGIQLVS